MYECDVWDFPGAFSGRRFHRDWLARQEFYNQVLSRHRLIWGESLRGLEHVRTPDDLYRCHSHNKGALVWGEKSPLYSVRLVQLSRRYPQASFILIWRDPVEIYRSIRVAGKKSDFFGRPGMLHRLIYHQEKMIREAAELERLGARVLQVNYDELVDATNDVCRNVCKFLQVDFDPRMLALEQADFSAIYNAPQHEFLKRGVIARQSPAQDVVEPACAIKLGRFRNRWERMAGRALGAKSIASQSAEPAVTELAYHKAAGAMLHVTDGFKRFFFEFLPLPWLRTYRGFKNWILARDNPGRRTSLLAQFRQHTVTIIFSFLLFGLAALVDYATGPQISCGPVYLIPCAALALVVGRGWGTIGALLCASSVTFFRGEFWHNPHALLSLTLIWNMAMRFIFFEIFVLLLDRIRRDLARENAKQNGSSFEL